MSNSAESREELLRQLNAIRQKLDELDGSSASGDDQRLDSEARSHSLEHQIEHSSLGVVEWDRSFTLTRWSSRAEEIFGWQAAEVLGKSWDGFRFVHDEDMERVKAVGMELIEAKVDYNTCTNRNYRKDGSVVHCEWFNSVHRDGQGKLNSWLSLVHDVSDRVHAQAESQRARNAMRHVIEGTTHVTGAEFFNSLVAHLADSLGTRYVVLSRVESGSSTAKTQAFWAAGKLQENVEYTLEGTPCAKVLAPSTCFYPDQIQQLFPNDVLLQDMQAQSYLGTPLISSNGEVLGLLSAIDDQPMEDRPEMREILELFANRAAAEVERVAAEKALNESRAILSAAIEATPAGIIIADAPDVRIRTVNSAALGIRNAPLDLLTDIPVQLHPQRWRCSHPDGTPYAPEDLPLSQAVLNGRVSKNVDVIIERGDGEKQWVLGNAAPVRNADGDIVAGVVVFPDVTDQRRAEEALRKLEFELAHVDRVSTMGEMVGGVAHELNQPLYAIQNFAKACGNLLAREESPDRVQLRTWLDQISSTAKYAGEVLLRLRNFVTRVPMNRSPVKISTMIDTALALTKHDAMNRGIRVVDRVPGSLPDVNADAVQIQQVLVNLLRNAFEATQIQANGIPRVTITAESNREFVEVTVADNGPGLPQETNQIFEPFNSTKPDGMGLGLAIGKTIIEGHGGTLTGSSGKQGGAIFRFTIPVTLDSGGNQIL